MVAHPLGSKSLISSLQMELDVVMPTRLGHVVHGSEKLTESPASQTQEHLNLQCRGCYVA